jgi:hypothetical protein
MARRGAISKPSPQVVLRGASGEVLPLIVERIKELLAEREARVAEHKLLTLHQKDVILD